MVEPNIEEVHESLFQMHPEKALGFMVYMLCFIKNVGILWGMIL